MFFKCHLKIGDRKFGSLRKTIFILLYYPFKSDTWSAPIITVWSFCVPRFILVYFGSALDWTMDIRDKSLNRHGKRQTLNLFSLSRDTISHIFRLCVYFDAVEILCKFSRKVANFPPSCLRILYATLGIYNLCLLASSFYMMLHRDLQVQLRLSITSSTCAFQCFPAILSAI